MLRNIARNTLIRFSFPVLHLKWKIYCKHNSKIKLVVGAGRTKFPGWFSTEVYFLDVTKEEDFQKLFSERKINNILAEHVLEHLTSQQLELMTVNFYKYSSDDVNIRIAVPDGYHNDEGYINSVKPGGTGGGAWDHKHLFNYKSLSLFFENAGFKAYPLEYWDENKTFNTTYKNDDMGYINRSFINDKRNSDGKPHYTSLIIDFKK